MPAQALYLKYRPRTFAQVQGQEHVTQTLKNAISQGRVAHAYLFTGPRGTGKTTIARVLAKAVNCLSDQGEKPCNACAVCRAINEERMLDLIEIDAASNTSVEDVRDLRDKVDFRPGEARFKVYIVDEVHMLSTAAFNALLKTLEEPPPHVIFVLATTDPQKIPATVLSRVQRFDFRRLTLPEIVARLGEIARNENLQVEPAALEFIARQATGALRDAISLLDQVHAYGGDVITLAQVQGLLGAGSHEAVGKLVARLGERDVAGGLTLLSGMIDGGVDPRQLGRELVEYLRGLLLIQAGSADALTLTSDELAEMSERAKGFTSERLLHSIRIFNQAAFELRSSPNPLLPLEVALVEASLEDSASARPAPAPAPPVRAAVAPAAAPVRPAAAPKPPIRAKLARPNSSPAPAPAAREAKENTPAIADGLTLDNLRSNWDQILARLRTYDRNAEAWLRGSAEPIRVDGDQVVLGFYYELHADRFEKQPNGKAAIEKAIGDIFRSNCRVKCVLSPKKARRKAVEQDPLIRTAIDELGATITEIHEQEEGNE